MPDILVLRVFRVGREKMSFDKSENGLEKSDCDSGFSLIEYEEFASTIL